MERVKNFATDYADEHRFVKVEDISRTNFYSILNCGKVLRIIFLNDCWEQKNHNAFGAALSHGNFYRRLEAWNGIK